MPPSALLESDAERCVQKFFPDSQRVLDSSGYCSVVVAPCGWDKSADSRSFQKKPPDFTRGAALRFVVGDAALEDDGIYNCASECLTKLLNRLKNLFRFDPSAVNPFNLTKGVPGRYSYAVFVA